MIKTITTASLLLPVMLLGMELAIREDQTNNVLHIACENETAKQDHLEHSQNNSILSSDIPKLEHEEASDFARGFKRGFAIGFIPIIGQAYLAISMFGNGLSSLGLGVQGIENVSDCTSFVSGVLVGHGASFSLYATLIALGAKFYSFNGGMMVAFIPPAMVFIVARILSEQS